MQFSGKLSLLNLQHCTTLQTLKFMGQLRAFPVTRYWSVSAVCRTTRCTRLNLATRLMAETVEERNESFPDNSAHRRMLLYRLICRFRLRPQDSSLSLCIRAVRSRTCWLLHHEWRNVSVRMRVHRCYSTGGMRCLVIHCHWEHYFEVLQAHARCLRLTV